MRLKSIGTSKHQAAVKYSYYLYHPLTTQFIQLYYYAMPCNTTVSNTSLSLQSNKTYELATSTPVIVDIPTIYQLQNISYSMLLLTISLTELTNKRKQLQSNIFIKSGTKQYLLAAKHFLQHATSHHKPD
eukprot:TRINITY_DN2064_c0_g2_i2.p4 TRINITY_DN2064_c0_g2~~TRINITY_DN2064_c0_g2_i2.p4  ORF type:complete len:130 (-),score=1.19 TRINITY_DN2064_c0_g2_i2:27-416(-)